MYNVLYTAITNMVTTVVHYFDVRGKLPRERCMPIFSAWV